MINQLIEFSNHFLAVNKNAQIKMKKLFLFMNSLVTVPNLKL